MLGRVSEGKPEVEDLGAAHVAWASCNLTSFKAQSDVAVVAYSLAGGRGWAEALGSVCMGANGGGVGGFVPTSCYPR